MKKIFLSKILPTVLLLTLTLTFNFIGYSNKAEAKSKDTSEEKVFMKNRDGSVSDSKFVTINAVPENWDATKATDEELKYYNYPERPKDSSKLALWKRFALCKWVKPELVETNIKHSTYLENTTTTSSAVALDTDTTNTTFDTDTTNTTFGTSNNWAGFVKKQQVDSAAGYWSIPKVSATSDHRRAYACQWVGLGGYGTETLVQAGTESDVLLSGSTSYYTWYELLGTNYKTPYSVKLSNITCKPGDIMMTEIKTSISGSTMTTTFHIANYTSNISTSFKISVDKFTNVPNSAEWIAEPPVASGVINSYPVTTDVETLEKTVRFTGCDYEANGTFYIIDESSNLVQVSLINGSTVLAKPTMPGTLVIPGIVSDINFGTFNVDWKAYK